MIPPTCTRTCFLENIRNRMPTVATAAVRVAVERSEPSPSPPR